MTQLRDTILIAFLKEGNEKSKCEFKPAKTAWKANLLGKSSRLRVSLRSTEPSRAEPSRTASKADVSHIDFHAQAHHLIPHDHLGEYAMHNWLPAGDAISGDSRAATTSTIATMASGCLMPIIFPNGSR